MMGPPLFIIVQTDSEKLSINEIQFFPIFITSLSSSKVVLTKQGDFQVTQVTRLCLRGSIENLGLDYKFFKKVGS